LHVSESAILKRFNIRGLRNPFDRWYVIRAQGYVDAYPDLRLKQHRVSHLTAYLNALG
jgi:hypothetical protein